MKDTWHDKLEFLPRMTNLVTVQIDVAKLYCSSGCCRKEVLKALLDRIKEMQKRRRRRQRNQKATKCDLYLHGVLNRKEVDILESNGFLSTSRSKVRGLHIKELSEQWETRLYLKHKILT